jgi:hypothetical protein
MWLALGGPQQPQVGGAQGGDLRPGLVEIRLVVAQLARPGVLVVSQDRGARLRQHHAVAISENDLRIGEMRRDLDDRPLAFTLRPPELRRAQPPAELVERRQQLGHHRQRIAVAQQCQQRRDVSRILVGR